MFKTLIIILFLFSIQGKIENIYSQKKIPGLVYKQDFSLKSSFDDFLFSRIEDWEWKKDSTGNAYLEIVQPGQYAPPVRSPQSLAVLDRYVMGDFVLEADLCQKPVPHKCKGPDCIICKHRDMCVFWGIQDSTHFYYAHIARHTDEVSHQIHIVDNAPRTAITSSRSNGVNWGKGTWNHIKVIHQDGKTNIYFNDMVKPVLESIDTTFMKGYIGFGSFDEMGKVDNIKLYADKYLKKNAVIFNHK